MATVLSMPPPGFDDLPEEEKLDYVQALWDRLDSHPEKLPTPDWHRRILDERLAAYRAREGAARPWPEVSEGLGSLRSRVKSLRSSRFST